MRKGMGGHQSARMLNDEWLTPPWIIEALGPFDTDPCSPVKRPWNTAHLHYNKNDDGLQQEWVGRVWLNPPYGNQVGEWMQKLVEQGDGIALIFARTETETFFDYVWEKADSALFIKGRLHFYDVHGVRSPHNSGAPSVLVAYGENNVEAISRSGIKGKHQLINITPVFVVGVTPTWRSVVSMALGRINEPTEIDRIYDMVEVMAPEKVGSNRYWKEKIRQQLRMHFDRIARGVYGKKA